MHSVELLNTDYNLIILNPLSAQRLLE